MLIVPSMLWKRFSAATVTRDRQGQCREKLGFAPGFALVCCTSAACHGLAAGSCMGSLVLLSRAGSPRE